VKRLALTLAVCFSLGVVSGQSALAQPPDADDRAKETTVLRLARSPDGLRFTPVQQVFLRNASSPDLDRLSDGTLLAVFDVRCDGDAGETRIGAATSKDDGRSWSPVKRIKISDRTGSPVRARHADVLPLSDGRVRLYFTTDAPKTRRVGDEKPTPACMIRSAIARDGGRYRVEPDIGLRFHDLPDAFAAAIYFKCRTHLYVSPGVPSRADKDVKADNSVRHAIARDGRRFARVAPIDIEDGVSIGSIVLLNDGLRAYGSCEKGIRSMASDDGAKWKLEPGVRLPRASYPAVTRLKDGSYLMLYASLADRETAEVAPLVAVSDPGDAADLPASGAETPGRQSGEIADSESADGAENAAEEVDALGFAPEPDFQEPIDYMQWYRQELVGPTEDNAFDAYAQFMIPADGESGNPSDWPVLNDMFNNNTYEGPPVPWKPVEHPEWEETHQAVQKLLSQFRDATRHSGYAPRVLREERSEGPTAEDRLLFNLLLPTLGPHRQIGKAALADAWRAPDGKVDGEKMIDAFETVLRSAEHLSRGSTLIESLVAMAQRQLTDINARWALKYEIFDEKQLEKAFETLHRYNQGPEDPSRFIRGEHAGALDATQYLFGAPCLGGAVHVDPVRAEYISNMVGDSETTKEDFIGLGQDDARAAIDAFNTYFREVGDQMRIGYPDVRAADIDAAYERYAHASPLTKMMMPAWSRYHHLRGRAEASRRATQLAYATHLYRARNGHWPESLDDLPEDVDRTIRMDPFSARDFGYRLTAYGPIIYSVSENGVDDRGVHSPRWSATEDNDSDDFVFWPPQERPAGP
jgi:hypothetical protein